MNKVKLGLKKLSAEQLIQYIRQIIKNLLGNIYFTSTTPASATVTTAINDYETALNNEKTAYETAKSMTATAHQKRIALELITNQLGNFIENASGGDAAKIKSTGMDIKASPVHHTGVPFKPTGMAASAGDKEGEIDLHWDACKDKSAKSYRVEICADPIDKSKWQQCKTATKSKVAVNHLTSGQGYWLRVCAINPKGESGWSDPAFKVAP
jgi:hypothetical protein